MICDLLALRPISHITPKHLYFLHSTKIEQITKTMANFKTGAIFFGAFAAIQYYREDRPAARAYLQRYHLLLRTTVKYRLHLHEE